MNASFHATHAAAVQPVGLKIFTHVLVVAVVLAGLVAGGRAASVTLVFESPTGSSATVSGGRASAGSPAFFATALPASNYIAGIRLGMNGTFTVTSPGADTIVIELGTGAISGYEGGLGGPLPIAYSFTLAGSGSLVVGSWTFSAGLNWDNWENLSFTGSGTGTFSGTNSITPAESKIEYKSALVVDYSGAASGDTLTITMNPANQGIAFNATTTAVPEPAAYAACFGMAALGIVMWRRRMQRSA